MANMSYCRFENTEIALNECLNALDEAIDGENELSEDEYMACRRLFKTFVNYLYENDIIGNDGDLEENLEDFLSSIPSEGV